MTNKQYKPGDYIIRKGLQIQSEPDSPGVVVSTDKMMVNGDIFFVYRLRGSGPLRQGSAYSGSNVLTRPANFIDGVRHRGKFPTQEEIADLLETERITG